MLPIKMQADEATAKLAIELNTTQPIAPKSAEEKAEKKVTGKRNAVKSSQDCV